MSGHVLWGIDLGGSKIEGVVLQPTTKPCAKSRAKTRAKSWASANVLCRKRIATQGSQGYGHVLNQIKSLIQAMSAEIGARPQRIGFGMPGTIEPATGLLRGSNSQNLNGKPLHKDLEKLLGIPVAMENDANCFALAETKLGVVGEVAENARVVFGVILGTGVGGGIVVNGNLISGTQSIAGEWGHNFLHESGGQCFCGRSGCVETVISGTGLEKYYASIAHQQRPLKQIVELAEAGDGDAVSTMDRLVQFFGLGISSIINILDPDVIVIGGGVGNIDLLYSRGVGEVAKHIFAPRLKTKIVKPKLGDSAGVFGAAFLFEGAPSQSG
ncbi:ROK family protein [Candidatus Spongiihabitans sp.]|uniref:ROK family protein n=1 Tax=Candidatus Spongiihabitans sp. TaxID=3101308 RepID=UPI003C7B27CD